MMVATPDRPGRRRDEGLHPAAAITLLVLGVAAVLAPHPPFLTWAGPPLLAAVALATGVIAPGPAGDALRPLGAPLAFVVFAVPFAVLLDRFGFFSQLAVLIGSGRRALGASWILTGLVVALLNLDAAVVLLTPLYIRLADRSSRSRVLLGVQPLLLSCLASSALPISNLTNLIAVSSLGLTTAGFLAHLALPTLAASAVGYLAYRRLAGRLAGLDPAPPSRRPAARRPAALDHPGAGAGAGRPAEGAGRLVAGGALVAAVVAGFLLAPSLGGQPWQVAAGADVVLVVATRKLPVAALPWRIVLTVLGLGVLAAAAAPSLHVARLLDGGGLGGVVRDVALGAAGANLVNNLPALLVALPGLGRHGGFASWSFLLGANVGPLVLPSASLAGLLWMDTMRRLGAPVRDRDYARLGWRVALPSLAVATAVLLALRVALGPL